MPETVRCTTCATGLLGYQIADRDPELIGRDACPVCGGEEFETVADEGSESGSGE